MKLYNHGEGPYYSIVSYSRPSLMIIASGTQVGDPSRGLLRDCTTSPINRFAALVTYDTVYGTSRSPGGRQVRADDDAV